MERSVVTKHLQNIFQEGELGKDSTCAKIAQVQTDKYAKGTKVIDVSAKDLAKIKIPVPSLAEQERIVSILDKFDALVNDLPVPSADGWRQAGISIGLPAELSARRSQYEYYRGKLLTFKEMI